MIVASSGSDVNAASCTIVVFGAKCGIVRIVGMASVYLPSEATGSGCFGASDAVAQTNSHSSLAASAMASTSAASGSLTVYSHTAPSSLCYSRCTVYDNSLAFCRLAAANVIATRIFCPPSRRS